MEKLSINHKLYTKIISRHTSNRYRIGRFDNIIYGVVFFFNILVKYAITTSVEITNF